MEFDIRKTNMVKCIAIILMFIHHLFSCSTELCSKYDIGSQLFHWNDIMLFSRACKVCVGIFVFLTAYGTMKIYQTKFANNATAREIEKFCMKRYVKLEMNFLFVYLLTVLTYFLRTEVNVWQIYSVDGWKKGIFYAIVDMFGLAYHFSFPTLNPTWWYMSTAILLVFLIPVLVKMYKIFGISVIVCCIFLFLGKEYDGVTEYILCMLLGIFCAETRMLEKLYEKKFFKQSYLNNCIKMLGYILIAGCILYFRIKMDMRFLVDAVITVLCCGFCMELSALCPTAEKIMNFIGMYSMNMFLTHTLLYLFYFPKFIYRFKNWIVVLIILTIMSLFLSIVIEKLKQKLGYKKMIEKVIIRLN